MEVIGPTLTDLKDFVGVDYEQISRTLVAKSVGFFVGSIIGGESLYQHTVSGFFYCQGYYRLLSLVTKNYMHSTLIVYFMAFYIKGPTSRQYFDQFPGFDLKLLV